MTSKIPSLQAKKQKHGRTSDIYLSNHELLGSVNKQCE